MPHRLNSTRLYSTETQTPEPVASVHVWTTPEIWNHYTIPIPKIISENKTAAIAFILATLEENNALKNRKTQKHNI